MTILAHNAAVLEVPVDTALLFSGDAMYQLWLGEVIDMVSATRDADAARMRAQNDG